MVDLSTRISRAIERIFRASEGFARLGVPKDSEMTGAEAGESGDIAPTSHESVESSPSVSERVLHQLASECSAARVSCEGRCKKSRRGKEKTESDHVSKDPNDMPVKPKHFRRSTRASGTDELSQAALKGHDSGPMRGLSNDPLSSSEKKELVGILQHLDPNYSMAEIDFLLDAISTGEITDVSFRSLRRVLAAVEKYGLDFVVSALQDEDSDISLPELPNSNSTTPPATTERGSDIVVPGVATVTETDNQDDMSTGGGSETDPGNSTSDTVEAALEEVQEELGLVEDELENLDEASAALESVQEELVEVQEELAEVEEELAAVQEELEEVKEVIEEIRQIIVVIRHHVRDFRLSRSHQADTLPHLRLNKNASLTSAFRKETQDTERFDTVQMNERRTFQKMEAEREKFKQEMAQHQWRDLIANSNVTPSDRRINPEAEAPDVT